MLVQEYIQAEEYVIDCVSKNGKHLLTEFWKYQKDITPDGGIR